MALHYASSRTPAGYLANLKPILDRATSVRTSWLRFLNDLANAEDVAGRSDEATQMAIRCREQFNEARRSLNQMTPPPMYQDMERALDGWLEALSASCEALANAVPPVTFDQVNAARRKLRDAAQEAEEPGERLGNNKRLIVLTVLGLILMIVALYFAFGALGTSNVGGAATP